LAFFIISNLELSYAGLANLVGSFLPDIDIWGSATATSREQPMDVPIIQLQ
jgi:hypothetical protein